jgi:hypothetical protein
MRKRGFATKPKPSRSPLPAADPLQAYCPDLEEWPRSWSSAPWLAVGVFELRQTGNGLRSPQPASVRVRAALGLHGRVAVSHAARRLPNLRGPSKRFPWGVGKHQLTKAYMLFLAHWARKLSWQETTRSFRSTWEKVCQSVVYVVQWGLEHRQLGPIAAIGVDEIQYARGHNYLTLVYQSSSSVPACRRSALGTTIALPTMPIRRPNRLRSA